MIALRKVGLLALGAALAATTIGGPVANAAPAHIDCGDPYFSVTSHHVDFKQVDQITEYNRTSRPSKISEAVGQSHKTTTKYGVGIDIGAQASFFKFASASASAKGHYSVKKTKTMKSSFRATGTASPHSKIVLRYGFSRYDQYIKHITPYSKTVNTCGQRVTQGWVDAPFSDTFIISN